MPAASSKILSAPAFRRIAVSGAGGLLGTRLGTRLAASGYRVEPLVRRPPRAGTHEIHWDPAGGAVDAAALQGVEGVVHLAGENIAAGRWNARRKAAIRDSRIMGTLLLAETLACLQPPPRVFVCASATGFYGDRGAELLDEDSLPGRGFLPDVCRAWEAATEPATAAGIRVVNARFGVVLSGEGGALAAMLTPFRLGMAGRLGTGQQYMSWITVTDAVSALVHALESDSCRGPVNVVAPQPVTNAVFTRALGRVLRRPTWLPMPRVLLRLVLGELADALLLASTRVLPRRLEQQGFVFAHREVETALRAVLGRPDG